MQKFYAIHMYDRKMFSRAVSTSDAAIIMIYDIS